MAAERLTMRKVKEVLRLKFDANLSNRQIAQSCSMAHSTVGEYIRRFRQSSLNWPLPDDIDDSRLEHLLFPPLKLGSDHPRPVPDFSYIHRELRRKGVTLMLLWQEYKQEHPQGYQYSQFCDLYRKWRGHIDPVMRQQHIAGEKMFVDYAGMSVAVYELKSDTVREAQIFVAVLGASNYSYAEATWTQSLPDWIGSHVRCFAFFGGVPQVVVPDNLKTGITKACFYEPDINPTYLDLANHYGTVVIPTRVNAPRDKAKVETGVQIVERWIRWAEKIGPHTTDLVRAVLSSRPHPQQGFRSCLGILRLAKSYGDERLEAACKRALTIGGTSYRSVESILKHNLDQKPLPDQTSKNPPINHHNIRGARYYH